MTVILDSTDNAEAVAMAQLRRMIALSPTFKTVVASYHDRLGRVWVEGSPDEALAAVENAVFSSDDLPFAVLWPISNEYVFAGGGIKNHVLASNSIHVYLRIPRTPDMDWTDARIEALRFLGNWMRDVTDLFGADETSNEGSPAVTGLGHFAGTRAVALEPGHVEAKSRASVGDFFFRSWAVSGGDDGGGQ